MIYIMWRIRVVIYEIVNLIIIDGNIDIWDDRVIFIFSLKLKYRVNVCISFFYILVYIKLLMFVF